ncbi:MAG: hypothetical protein ACLPJH_06910 [Myxococcaceae bacterium]
MRNAHLLLVLALAACAAPLKPLPPPAAGPETEDAAALAAQSRAATQKAQHESSAEGRRALAQQALAAGQRCQRAAPTSAACDYALALALGVQAREQPTTATQGLPLMVKLLQKANQEDARLDSAGPLRVLALVLLRAPGWPLGPGDVDAGVKAAREAVALFADYAPNQLALSEALLVAGDESSSRAAAMQGLELARAAAAAGDADAQDWVRDGEGLLSGKAPR